MKNINNQANIYLNLATLGAMLFCFSKTIVEFYRLSMYFSFVNIVLIPDALERVKDSKYRFDKRTKDWIKCKVLDSTDCVICGYVPKENNMISLILGQYDKNELVYIGHVILNQHKYKVMDDSPFGYIPKGNQDAIWMVPELVCIVESMPTDKESFRQPVFKGIRDDKTAKECQIKPTD